jgi:HEPN pEK499 p136
MSRKQVALSPRNDPLGLAQRSWTNLLIIEGSFKERREGHIVTQLVQSLLTILVFPKEKAFFDHLAHLRLDTLTNWPIPRQVLGTTPNMAELLRHIRNAVCHGLITFYGDSKSGPDSRFVDEVSLQFEDRPKPQADVNWCVVMEGKDLKLFLYRLFDYLHDGLLGPFECRS